MLKIGMSLVDISPEKGVQLTGYPHCPRPNEGIHDPLYAACMFIDNGKERVAIVTADLLHFSKDFMRELRGKFDFPILASCSHTHCGPLVGVVHDFEYAEGIRRDDGYVRTLMDKVTCIIEEASNNTFVGSIGTYVGHCGAEQGIGGNRREKGGLADPSVNIIAAKDTDGKIRGILLNYTLHPTYLHAENVFVSADYPGYIRRFFGFACPDAVFMFAQGTSGNQSSRYHRVGQTFEEACRAGTTIAVEVFHSLEKIDFKDTLDIEYKSIEIELPRKSFPPRDEAKAAMIKARERFESLKSADYITMRNAELDMFGAEDIYYLALEADSGYVDPDLPCEIQKLILGDTAILGSQGELFVEYGLAIKAASKYEKTFVFELSSAALPGYVYTPDAVNDGGYEVGNSTFTPDAGEVIVKAAEKLLNN